VRGQMKTQDSGHTNDLGIDALEKRLLIGKVFPRLWGGGKK